MKNYENLIKGDIESELVYDSKGDYFTLIEKVKEILKPELK